jgi:hypothetical protein
MYLLFYDQFWSKDETFIIYIYDKNYIGKIEKETWINYFVYIMFVVK